MESDILRGMILTPFVLFTLLITAAACLSVFLTGRIVFPLTAGAVLWVLVTSLGVLVQRLRFFGPVQCRQSPEKGILLTFDDGPDPESTPAVLAFLDRSGRKAVFFLVGQKALAHPGLVREILARGHRIGSHTDRHLWYTNFLVGRPLREELEAGISHLAEAGAESVTLFRYPMGLSNPSIAGRIRKLGLSAIGWNRRCFDTVAADPELIFRRLAGARSGDIILLHDAGRNVPAMLEALERADRIWKGKGY